MAGKVRNPKSEIRNPKQIPMSKGASPQDQATAGGLIGRVLRICHLNFVLVSDFEFRISDLSSQGSGVQPKRCGTCSGEGRGRTHRASVQRSTYFLIRILRSASM